MTADIQKLLTYIQAFIGSVTPQQWYGLGLIFGSIAATTGVVAWIKRRHLKATAEKLASHLTMYYVIITSAVLAATDFIILNGATLSSLGGFLPFWVANGAKIMAGAIAAHEFVISSRKWLQGRKELLSPKTLETIENAAKDIPQPGVISDVKPVTSSLWSE